MFKNDGGILNHFFLNILIHRHQSGGVLEKKWKPKLLFKVLAYCPKEGDPMAFFLWSMGPLLITLKNYRASVSSTFVNKYWVVIENNLKYVDFQQANFHVIIFSTKYYV